MLHPTTHSPSSITPPTQPQSHPYLWFIKYTRPPHSCNPFATAASAAGPHPTGKPPGLSVPPPSAAFMLSLVSANFQIHAQSSPATNAALAQAARSTAAGRGRCASWPGGYELPLLPLPLLLLLLLVLVFPVRPLRSDEADEDEALPRPPFAAAAAAFRAAIASCRA